MKIIVRFIYSVFLALDLLASALTFGAPLQTLSARFAKWRAKGYRVGTFLANTTDYFALVLFGATNHCAGALAAYCARVAAAPSWSG